MLKAKNVRAILAAHAPLERWRPDDGNIVVDDLGTVSVVDYRRYAEEGEESFIVFKIMNEEGVFFYKISKEFSSYDSYGYYDDVDYWDGASFEQVELKTVTVQKFLPVDEEVTGYFPL